MFSRVQGQSHRSRLGLWLLGALALLGVCAILSGCGSDSETTVTAEQNQPSAAEKREDQENREVKRELAKGDFVDCGGQVFVNKRIFCTFAKNMRTAYYSEVVSGPGKAVGLHPPAGRDYRVFCTGTVPHRCTGFKDDGGGIKPLKGVLIFFSP
jgi:hypothetical protein